MNRQSRFDAGYRMPGAGALGWFRKIPSFLSTPSLIIHTSIKDKKYLKCQPAKYMKKEVCLSIGYISGESKGKY